MGSRVEGDAVGCTTRGSVGRPRVHGRRVRRGRGGGEEGGEESGEGEALSCWSPAFRHLAHHFRSALHLFPPCRWPWWIVMSRWWRSSSGIAQCVVAAAKSARRRIFDFGACKLPVNYS